MDQLRIHAVMVHYSGIGKKAETSVFYALEDSVAIDYAYRCYVELYEPVRDIVERHVYMITEGDDYGYRVSRAVFEKVLIESGQVLLSDHDLDAHIYITYAVNNLEKK